MIKYKIKFLNMKLFHINYDDNASLNHSTDWKKKITRNLFLRIM